MKKPRKVKPVIISLKQKFPLFSLLGILIIALGSTIIYFSLPSTKTPSSNTYTTVAPTNYIDSTKSPTPTETVEPYTFFYFPKNGIINEVTYSLTYPKTWEARKINYTKQTFYSYILFSAPGISRETTLFTGETITLGNDVYTQLSEYISSMKKVNRTKIGNYTWDIYSTQACGPQECLSTEFVYTVTVKETPYTFIFSEEAKTATLSMIKSFKVK